MTIRERRIFTVIREETIAVIHGYKPGTVLKARRIFSDGATEEDIRKHRESTARKLQQSTMERAANEGIALGFINNGSLSYADSLRTQLTGDLKALESTPDSRIANDLREKAGEILIFLKLPLR